MTLSLKSCKVTQYRSQRSHALSLSHHLSLVNQKEDAQKTKTKQHIEQHRVLLAPRGKTEWKTMASSCFALRPTLTETLGATRTSIYRNQNDLLLHRMVLGPKYRRALGISLQVPDL